MATGTTTSNSAELQTIIDKALLIREYTGTWSRTCEVQRKPAGTGLSYEETTTQQLSAQSVDENTILDSPQQIQDLILTATPTQCGIMTRVTRLAKFTISKKQLATWGETGQIAMDRYKNDAYLTSFDTGTSLSGTGTTLVSGVIGAAARRISSNPTESGGDSPISTVLHGYQIHDLQSEIVSGIGTYTVPQGLTEEVYKHGWRGTLYNTNVYEDGNIVIDSSTDADGGVHPRKGLILVQGMEPAAYEKFNPAYGGGADEYYLYDHFIFVERHAGGGSSGGGWLFQIKSNATAPTS